MRAKCDFLSSRVARPQISHRNSILPWASADPAATWGSSADGKYIPITPNSLNQDRDCESGDDLSAICPLMQPFVKKLPLSTEVVPGKSFQDSHIHLVRGKEPEKLG